MQPERLQWETASQHAGTHDAGQFLPATSPLSRDGWVGESELSAVTAALRRLQKKPRECKLISIPTNNVTHEHEEGVVPVPIRNHTFNQAQGVSNMVAPPTPPIPT